MIMQVLWNRGRATAREITDLLNRDEQIAHSTVQTLLRKLEDKGAITHDEEDRVFVYRALAKEDKVTKSATRDLIDRVFSGSASGLIAYLLRNERVASTELEQIQKLIDEKRTRKEERR
jgi:BlaI family penicillinase repressor